jgi:hypothetical protein
MYHIKANYAMGRRSTKRRMLLIRLVFQGAPMINLLHFYAISFHISLKVLHPIKYGLIAINQCDFMRDNFFGLG